MGGPDEVSGLLDCSGEPVVKVRNDSESGALRVAQAHADPVVPAK